MDSSPAEGSIRLNWIEFIFFSKINVSAEVPNRSKICKIKTLDSTTEKKIPPPSWRRINMKKITMRQSKQN